jgi:hypothetical protein
VDEGDGVHRYPCHGPTERKLGDRPQLGEDAASVEEIVAALDYNRYKFLFETGRGFLAGNQIRVSRSGALAIFQRIIRHEKSIEYDVYELPALPAHDEWASAT